jgi:Domain of unknown function (DUF4476)
MLKYLLAAALTFTIGYVSAQLPPPTSNLTIFSEDGYKFYLILNGERQNDKPETNIRVEELPQPYYNCKVIFDDKTQADISKNYLMLTDAEGNHNDVTYKIKKDKNGKPTLKYFSSSPLVPNMPPLPPPAGVAVYHFGVTTAPAVTTTVTETTTSAPSSSGTHIGVNVGGIGMNVHVDDIGIGETHSTHTTTTTTTTSAPAPVVETRPSGCAGYAMSAGDFESALGTIQAADFESTKLSTAKQIAAANCLYADQIVQICRIFGFEASKLDFAKQAYTRCIDRPNYFKVNSVFDFDSSKSELSKYTSGRR